MAQELVTGHLPEPVPFWDAPTEADGGVTPHRSFDQDAMSQELARLRNEVESLRHDLYDRVSGAIFHQELENTSRQIGGIWQYLTSYGGGSDRFFTFCVLLARQVAQRDPLFGHARFCEAILVAVGLTDREEWAGHYWNDLRTAPSLANENYAFLDTICRSGLIKLPEQAGELDDIGFVTVCYAVILGRRPDPFGLADNVEKLADGVGREDLVKEFQGSEEAAAVQNRRRQSAPVLGNNEASTVSSAFWTDLYRMSLAFALS